MKKLLFILSLTLGMVCFAAVSPEGEDTRQFEQPALITSAGQSAESQIASVLAKRAGIDHAFNKLAAEKDLNNVKTLVLVVGASMKGLGAAGLDKEKEKARVNALIQKARHQKIPVLVMHLGGKERRGDLSDFFISAFLPQASMVLAVRPGDYDGFLSSICKKHDIRLILHDRALDMLEPLKQLFKPMIK